MRYDPLQKLFEVTEGTADRRVFEEIRIVFDAQQQTFDRLKGKP